MAIIAKVAEPLQAPVGAMAEDVARDHPAVLRRRNAVRGRFHGCGGSNGGGRAVMKLQVRWGLRSGALDAVAVEPGRSPLKTRMRRRIRAGVGTRTNRRSLEH